MEFIQNNIKKHYRDVNEINYVIRKKIEQLKIKDIHNRKMKLAIDARITELEYCHCDNTQKELVKYYYAKIIIDPLILTREEEEKRIKEIKEHYASLLNRTKKEINNLKSKLYKLRHPKKLRRK